MFSAASGTPTAVVTQPANILFRGFRAPMCVICTSRQKTGDRDIFIQVVPMETTRTEFVFFALFLGGARQPRKPGERNPEHSAIRQLDHHPVVIEADADRLN